MSNLSLKMIQNGRVTGKLIVHDVTDKIIEKASPGQGEWYYDTDSHNVEIPSIDNSIPFTTNMNTIGYRSASGETALSSPLRNYPYIDITDLEWNNNEALIRFELEDLGGHKRYLCLVINTTSGGGINYAFTKWNENYINLNQNSTNNTFRQETTLSSGWEYNTAEGVYKNRWKHSYLRAFCWHDNAGRYKLFFSTQRFNDEDSSSGYSVQYGYSISLADLQQYWGEITTATDEGMPEESETGGYNGTYDDSSDIISIPDQPTLSVSSMGLINIYKPSVDGLMGFVNDLFPDIDFPEISGGFDLEAVVDALQGVCETIVNGVKISMNEKLLDYVLDVHLLPVNPSAPGNEQIHVGYKQSSVTAPKVTSDYVDFYCGELNISEYYGNFLDYEGTKAQLYLPFVGYVPINNEYFQNGKLSVTYRFNVLDGSFVCFVVSTSSKSKLKDSVIGTYSGNCCVHVPISASSFSNVISGLIGGASQISGVTRSIDKEHKKPSDLSGAASAALSVASEKPQLLMNNGYTATSSYLGIRQPYLIIERPVAVYPKDYKTNYGLPSFITKKLKECKGYTKCDISHFKTFKSLPSYADDRDMEEIKNMLNDYIIL